MSMPRFGSTSRLPKKRSGCSFSARSESPLRVLVERHAEHALFDAELVHLLQQEADRIVARLRVRHVLEHVLGGELELVERLVVAQALAQELVGPRTGAKRRGDHQIDHADVGRHGHADSLYSEGTRQLPRPRKVPRGRGSGQIRTAAFANVGPQPATAGAMPARMGGDEPEDRGAATRRALPDRVPLGA